MTVPTLPDFSLNAVRELAKREHFPSISIYLPTHRAGPDTQQDPIRYRDLLKRAETHLIERGVSQTDSSRIIAPAERLLHDTEFWRHQADGLAVLVGPDELRTYSLPFSPAERVAVGTSYVLYPMLPMLTHDGRFFVLALTQKSVRLFECTRTTVHGVELPAEMPRSLKMYAMLDEPERQLNYHTSTPQYASGVAQFHGRGGEAENSKVLLTQFLQEVDRGLRTVLGDRSSPLVLAMVDYEAAMFRSAAKYQPIMDDIVTGSTEHMEPRELLEAAWPIAEPYFRRDLEKVFESFYSRRPHGLATARIQDIVAKAATGQVDTVVVATDTVVRGRYDPATLSVEVRDDDQFNPDDIDLLEFAAVQTLTQSGAAFATERTEIPEQAAAIAILRPG